MYASRWTALWPQVVAISLIGLGAAGCTDSGRFNDIYASDSASHADVTGSIPRRAPLSHVVARPMPPLAQSGTEGVSGGGGGMASYRPRSSEITGSVPAAPPPPPPPRWTWSGGRPVTVGPGETLDMISRKYGVPVYAIMQANNIAKPGAVYAGQHLVIPRYRPSPERTAYVPPRYSPQTFNPRTAAAPYYAPRKSAAPSYQPTGYEPPRRSVAAPAERRPAPRTALGSASGVHVVSPGETLNSIARLYGKSVRELAKANNIPPDTMVRIGQRLVIPGAQPERRAEAVPPPPVRREVAAEQSPHSAWKASTVEPAAQPSVVKAAQPVGSLPSFRWPVHGRIIAGFGPRPNGLQNDGIDVAVPEGTPIKAADDGVVAYAGNELKGYGNLVLIRHSDGYVTAYAHASEILVKRGETVKRGQVIAKAGETGNVRTPELHFEIRKGARPINPAQFLGGA
jgi:murein DD-endopeptidase MepM/ murein hydrolase activator NlpD